MAVYKYQLQLVVSVTDQDLIDLGVTTMKIRPIKFDTLRLALKAIESAHQDVITATITFIQQPIQLEIDGQD